MSTLFEPLQLGNMQIRTRFVHSATCESVSEESGAATDALINRYRTLARGEVGLIITGFMYVHPLGQCYKYQTGVHTDEMIPGLKRLVDAIHEEGGAVVFQLAHGGRHARADLIGQTPMGPSNRPRDPVYFFNPKKMTEAQIDEVIQAFAQATRRAVEAGADGVQIHGAHGYLLSQFLSPFFNDRQDAWGGSDENRFRLLREVVLAAREAMPEGMLLLVKLNGRDHTPKEGITPPLAARYAGWLADLGVDGLEVSCGTTAHAVWNLFRGDVPVDELARAFPWWQQPLAKMILKQSAGKFDLEEGYNLEAARVIRAAVGSTPLSVVGGMRSLRHMEQVVEGGDADLISMSRPFIREPFLVKRFREGQTEVAACQSCNLCVAALVHDMPVRCYAGGFP
jgi:2,4-dienoyl-CoA reductase-like NADH-dependent reductase (Old Yellow Enzyme family)